MLPVGIKMSRQEDRKIFKNRKVKIPGIILREPFLFELWIPEPVNPDSGSNSATYCSISQGSVRK